LCWQYVSVRLLSKIHSCRSLVTILSVGKFMEMLGIYHESEYIYIIIWYVWAGAVLMSGHICLWFQDIPWRDSPWFAVIPQCAFPIFDSRASTFQSCSCTSTLLMCLTSWDGRVVELWNSVKHCGTVSQLPEATDANGMPYMPMVIPGLRLQTSRNGQLQFRLLLSSHRS
jgi:hypothetical protein